MADKALEKFYVAILLGAIGIPLDQEPAPHESPDFIVRSSGQVIGVEIVRFFLPTAPGSRSQQELEGLRNLATTVAQQRHRAMGGRPLYVHFDFAEDCPGSKHEAYRLGGLLADALRLRTLPRTLADGPVEINSDELPRGVNYCRLVAAIDDDDGSWHQGGIGFVEPVEPHHVQQVLDDKEIRLRDYRSKCSVVWLAIVQDFFRGGKPCALSAQAITASYHFGFDRVYWFVATSAAATPLNRST